jgi:hypothetical protein
MILVITYDLNNTTKDYSSFFGAIQQQGPWWHYLKNTWLLDTQKPPKQVWEALAPHVEQGDRIMIVRLSAPYWGWLPKDAWDWVSSRVPNT